MTKEFNTAKLLELYTFPLVQLKKMLGYAVYNVDKELVLMARKDAQLLMQRYEDEGIRRDWKPKEKQTMFYGLLGEQIFKATLYELKIDYQYAEPMYPHELRRPHDFECAGKTIQIKTIQPNGRYRNLVIKIDEWSESDFTVPIKLVDKDLTKAHIIGFLTKKELEQLPVARNEYPCPYEPCYYCSLDEVTRKHTAYELFKILKE